MSARTKERRERIMVLAKQEGFVSVVALSQLFSVSEVTIRGDLDMLESQNVVTRMAVPFVVTNDAKSSKTACRVGAIASQRERMRKSTTMMPS